MLLEQKYKKGLSRVAIISIAYARRRKTLVLIYMAVYMMYWYGYVCACIRLCLLIFGV